MIIYSLISYVYIITQVFNSLVCTFYSFSYQIHNYHTQIHHFFMIYYRYSTSRNVNKLQLCKFEYQRMIIRITWFNLMYLVEQKRLSQTRYIKQVNMRYNKLTRNTSNSNSQLYDVYLTDFIFILRNYMNLIKTCQLHQITYL